MRAEGSGNSSTHSDTKEQKKRREGEEGRSAKESVGRAKEGERRTEEITGEGSLQRKGRSE